MPARTPASRLPSAGPVALAAAVALLTGCVDRTVKITSEPSGALVWLNEEEVGRTPVEVNFVHYGRYDVRLVKEGFEPLLTTGEAKAPLWDAPGFDFFAEVLPARLESRLEWHYVLEPRDDDRGALVERARAARDEATAAPDGAPTP